MGLLNRSDARHFRKYFVEMAKLKGISAGYQYIIKQEYTIHSEDNSTLSAPMRIDILLDENPPIATLNRMGWVIESNDSPKPIIATLPYNTPNLTVNARIILETIDGVNRYRTFKITKIISDFEYPDTYTVALVPVYDQKPQKNHYTLVNNEKISTDNSDYTSENQPYKYLTEKEEIDTTPQEYIKWSENYSFIDDRKGPYDD